MTSSQSKAGLKNLGNTCFMNSIIQCLSLTSALTQFWLDGRYRGEVNTANPMGQKGALALSFQELVEELWGERARVVTPTKFKRAIGKFAPRFLGYAQQDSQEFLRFLLDGLHEDLSRVTRKPPLAEEDPKVGSWPILTQSEYARDRYKQRFNSFIIDTFAGQLRSTLKCTTCHHESITFDPFWDLSVPIPGSGKSKAGSGASRYSRSTSTGPASCSIYDCLSEFTKEEVLDGDEMPTCEKCKKRRRCIKRLSLQRMPKVLVLHIKRFSFDSRSRSKIATNVKFPLDKLDCSPYCDPATTSPEHHNARYESYESYESEIRLERNRRVRPTSSR